MTFKWTYYPNTSLGPLHLSSSCIQAVKDALSALFDVMSAGLRRKFGPQFAVHYAAHSLFKAIERYMGGVILFVFLKLHHPLALKDLNFMFFFTNPALSSLRWSWSEKVKSLRNTEVCKVKCSKALVVPLKSCKNVM